MIRLSKVTDYAIVVLSQMARTQGGLHTAARLSEQTGVPAPTVAKILKQLASSGVVGSSRGAGGGYRLSRRPECVSVVEIITALEGPIAITACVSGAETQCGVESLCPIRGNWERVNRAIAQALGAVTLADMLTPAWALQPELGVETKPGYAVGSATFSTASPAVTG